MARVLMVGIDPADVDFSDPALPPGVDADMIRRGIEIGREELRTAGHEVTQLYIRADGADLPSLADRLASEPAHCVVIGGGVRMPPRNLLLFESLLNVIARADPSPAVALVGKPDESAAAVARVLG